MKTANYNIRLDPVIKTKAEETFAEFGLNLSEAINVFLHMSIRRNGFPFELVYHNPNDMLRASIHEADAMLENSNIKTYSTVAELNAAMDAEDEADGEYV
jgi:DNA-damage-inducible protein J